MRRAALGILAVLAGIPGAVGAQPLPERDLPPVLRPWSAWIRDEMPDRVCTAVQGAAVCLWPGRLDLRLAGDGGTFTLEAYADRALELRLPGDTQRWPQDVRMDGRPAVVVERDEGPALRLPAGTHRIDGRFVWTHLPDSIPVPPRLALVDLAVSGRRVPLPRRDEAGLVWLRTEGESAAAAESLRLQAFRRVADGIPIWVETRLSLEVSGKAREIELVGALLPGTTVVAVSGQLPARIDETGRLRIQVRAGTFAVTVLARVDGRPDAIARAAVVQPWPAREVWVFAANETLRQVELSGLQPVDPSRTDLPPEWRALPAFLVEPDARLALKEVRRGEAEGRPIASSSAASSGSTSPAVASRCAIPSRALSRAHGGSTCSGRRSPAASASTPRNSSSRPTHDPGPGRGAAPRRAQPGSRLARRAWRTPSGRGLVGGRRAARGHSPLAARLVAAGRHRCRPAPARGRAGGRCSDSSSYSSSRWPWPPLRPRMGVIALLAVVFLYDEPGAPFLVWLSLLGATALSAVAPEGWLRRLARLWRGASLLVLLVILVPFVRDQVREALYPQIRSSETFSELLSSPVATRAVPMAAPPATVVPQMSVMPKENADQPQQSPAYGAATDRIVVGVEGGVAGGVVGGVPDGFAADEVKVQRNEVTATRQSTFSMMNTALEQDPRAVVQTGPGVPSWSWSSYPLGWSGPVKSDQTIRLWLVSPA
jgi:hypothetical protein